MRDVDFCNATEVKIFSDSSVPEDLMDYSDGYKMSSTTTVAPQGVLGGQSTGTCWGEQSDLSGYYCHYLTAGDSDYEFSMHTVTYWESTNTSRKPMGGSYRSTDIQFGQHLGSLPNGMTDTNGYELRTIMASD